MKIKILIYLVLAVAFLIAGNTAQADPQRHRHEVPEVLIVNDIKADVVRARVIRANDVHAEYVNAGRIYEGGKQPKKPGSKGKKGKAENIKGELIEADEIIAHNIKARVVEADTLYVHKIHRPKKKK